MVTTEHAADGFTPSPCTHTHVEKGRVFQCSTPSSCGEHFHTSASNKLHVGLSRCILPPCHLEDVTALQWNSLSGDDIFFPLPWSSRDLMWFYSLLGASRNQRVQSAGPRDWAEAPPPLVLSWALFLAPWGNAIFICCVSSLFSCSPYLILISFHPIEIYSKRPRFLLVNKDTSQGLQHFKIRNSLM